MRKKTLETLSEKFMDMGNYSVVGLSFVALASGKTLDLKLFFSGVLLWFVFYGIGVGVAGLGGEDQ